MYVGKNNTLTEGNGEVDVTNKGEVGGVGTLGLDQLDESVCSLGDSVGSAFGRKGGRGRRRVEWVPDARTVGATDII